VNGSHQLIVHGDGKAKHDEIGECLDRRVNREQLNDELVLVLDVAMLVTVEEVGCPDGRRYQKDERDVGTWDRDTSIEFLV
jgi:hypothetical protein